MTPPAWYQPAGAYEARKALTEDGTLIEARYLGDQDCAS